MKTLYEYILEAAHTSVGKFMDNMQQEWFRVDEDIIIKQHINKPRNWKYILENQDIMSHYQQNGKNYDLVIPKGTYFVFSGRRENEPDWKKGLDIHLVFPNGDFMFEVLFGKPMGGGGTSVMSDMANKSTHIEADVCEETLKNVKKSIKKEINWFEPGVKPYNYDFWLHWENLSHYHRTLARMRAVS